MGIRALGESIILQSLEDLASAEYRQDSICFFRGEGFRLSAEIAGLDVSEMKKIIDLSTLIPPAKTRVFRKVTETAGGVR
jgi:hypothetical protein